MPTMISIPNSDWTGDDVQIADIKSVGAFDKVDTRVEPPVGGTNTPQYQIVFTLLSNPTGNPIVWTAPSENSRDTGLASVQAAIATAIEAS